MAFYQVFLLLLAFFTLPNSVTLLPTLTTPTLNPIVGQDMIINCSDSVSFYGDDRILSLGLEIETRPGIWQDVVKYMFRSTEFEAIWGAAAGNWQYRAQLETLQELNLTRWNKYELFFTFTLPDIRCSDSAALRCRTRQSFNFKYSPPRYLDVAGITTNPRISGGTMCSSFEADPITCEKCSHSTGFNTTPLYATADREMKLTCAAELAMPTSDYYFIWYKRVGRDSRAWPIYENVTFDIPSAPRPDKCVVDAFSTLRYYPRSEDRELQFFCELSNKHMSLRSTNVSVCIPENATYVNKGTSAIQGLSVLASMLLLLFSCFIALPV